MPETQLGTCETCGALFHRTKINEDCEICKRRGLPSRIIPGMVEVL